MRTLTAALPALLGLAACSAERPAARDVPGARAQQAESDAAPTAQPVPVSAAESARPAPLPPAADRRAWHAIAPWSDECEDAFRSARPEDAELAVFAVAPKLTLIEVPCDVAAYQAAFNYVLLDERRDPARHALLRFPVYDGARWQMQAWVAGIPRFHQGRGELEVWSKARGIGDCGQLARYAFPDGALRIVWMRVRACDDADIPDSLLDPYDWPLIRLDTVPGIPAHE